MTRFHVTDKLVNTPFSNTPFPNDRILTKNLYIYILKIYTA